MARFNGVGSNVYTVASEQERQNIIKKQRKLLSIETKILKHKSISIGLFTGFHS